MPDAAEHITTAACDVLRRTIFQAKGSELYFIGKLDRRGKIDKVRPVARGGPRSQRILMTLPQHGDVIIHNHKVKLALGPTSADDDLAQRLEEKGVGFLLIDNDVQDVHVMLEPYCDNDQPEPLDEEAMTALLGPNGPLAQHLPGYEQRHEQVEMLRHVVRSFNHDQVLMVEAGTGTGKSLAYLLPAVYWAKQNNERVLVSTNTINLQEQVFQKDVPFLQQVLDVPFKAALVKGRNNYLCIRKLQQQSLNKHQLDITETQSFQKLETWGNKTTSGDRSELSFIPPAQSWSSVAADVESCQRMRCEFYQSCFYYMARRKQAQADVLITNHHILFADLAVRDASDNYHAQALLPPYQRVVLDEAHNIEDSASSFLGFQVTRAGINRSLAMLVRQNRRKEEVGLLHQLAILLLDHNKFIVSAERLRRDLLEDLIPQVRRLRDEAVRTSERFHDLLGEQQSSYSGGFKVRVTPSLIERGPWPELQQAGQDFAAELQTLSQRMVRLAETLENESKPVEKSFRSPMMDLSAAITRLGNAAQSLHAFFDPDSDHDEDDDSSASSAALVRWFELKADDKQSFKLQCAPLELGHDLERMLFDNFGTVALASATLATGQKDFSYISRRLGIDLLPEARKQTATYPSPFAYGEQTLIGIPQDLPYPNDPRFEEHIGELIYQALVHSDGRAFVLCTSFSLLRALHQRLAPRLQQELGIRSLCQGEAQRHILLRRKIQDERSVLFGTDSFWEGVDVRGRALTNVILTRLPFRVPSEPLIEARIEAIEERGGNSFLEYTVPAATIKFKQGFGRLIRSRGDRGTVLILDKRVIEKHYGKRFLNALPQACPRVVGNTEHVLAQLAAFHRAGQPTS